MKLLNYRFRYFAAKNKGYFSLFIFNSIIYSMLNALSILFFAFLFEALVSMNGQNIVIYLVVQFVIFILTGATQILGFFLQENLVNKIKLNFRDEINKNINQTNISFNLKINQEKYLSLIYNDLEILIEKYFKPYLETFEFIILIISEIIVFFILSYILALIILFLGILNIFMPILLKKYISKKTEKFSVENNKYNSKILKVLNLYNFLILNGRRNLFKIKTEKENDIFSQKTRKFDNVKRNVTYIENLVLISLNLVVFIIASFLVINNFASVGIISTAISSSAALLKCFSDLTSRYSSIVGSKSLMNNYNEFFQNNLYNLKGKKILNNFTSKIEFINYRSLFITNKKNEKEWNLVFEKGKKYLISGDNGIGKSILLKSLININTNYKGEILIDGNNVTDIDRNSLINLVTYSTNTNSILDNKKLSENIALEKIFEENKINNTIKEANLDFYTKNFVVNENGNNLSQGQIQRIGLARVFYNDSPIQIFDESFANLDSGNKNEIISKILNKKDKTIIMVAHHIDENIISKFDEHIHLSNSF